jgi:hypothetical protein
MYSETPPQIRMADGAACSDEEALPAPLAALLELAPGARARLESRPDLEATSPDEFAVYSTFAAEIALHLDNARLEDALELLDVLEAYLAESDAISERLAGIALALEISAEPPPELRAHLGPHCLGGWEAAEEDL